MRCSRCKHAFRIEVPASDEDERIQRAAEQALEPKTPPATQDLTSEEQDWEFNVARNAEDAAADDEGFAGYRDSEDEGVPELADPSSVDLSTEGSDQDLSLADPSDSDRSGASVDHGIDLSARDHSGFDLSGGSMDDYSSPSADEDRDSGLDLDAGLGQSATGDAQAPGIDLSAASSEAPEPPALGGPEEWDFFAADANKGPAQSPRAAAPVAAPRIRQVQSTTVEIDDAADASRPAWLVLASRVAGWCVVCAALVFGVYSNVTAYEPAVAITSLRVGGLELDDMSGRWLDNLVSGNVYVVSALARTAADAQGGQATALSVQLLDARGEPLKGSPVPVGAPVPEAVLRTTDVSTLHQLAEAQPPLVPGEARRIQVVLSEMPAAARSIQFIGTRQAVPAAVPTSAIEVPASAQPDAAALAEVPAAADAGSGALPEGSGQQPPTG